MLQIFHKALDLKLLIYAFYPLSCFRYSWDYWTCTVQAVAHGLPKSWKWFPLSLRVFSFFCRALINLSNLDNFFLAARTRLSLFRKPPPPPPQLQLQRLLPRNTPCVGAPGKTTAKWSDPLSPRRQPATVWSETRPAKSSTSRPSSGPVMPCTQLTLLGISSSTWPT